MPNGSKLLVHILRFRKLKIRENQQTLVIDLAALYWPLRHHGTSPQLLVTDSRCSLGPWAE